MSPALCRLAGTLGVMTAREPGKTPRGGARTLPVAASLLRAVESQHLAATMRLVPEPAAQAVLEAALERSKPPVPAACAGLDYLLHTPFRYPPSPWPSRFRAATDAGVFYGAESERTALAEVSHWRLRFLRDAIGLPALEPTAHTLFRVRIQATIADAARLQPASKRAAVLDPNDYAAAQAWARDVRALGRQAIRYPSVRDAPQGRCWALFDPAAFRSRPQLTGTWLIRVDRQGAQCRRTGEPGDAGFAFPARQLLCS